MKNVFDTQDIQEINISLKKKYNFPDDIQIINYKDKWLIISVETGNWIVADDQIEKEFFEALQICSIEDSMSLVNITEEECYHILTQIEARHIESTEVTKKVKAI